jgi:hypothetical protein
VFLYDRRGRGESGNVLPDAVEREIEDIDAMIKAASGWAFLFGVSSGAALALAAARSVWCAGWACMKRPSSSMTYGRPSATSSWRTSARSSRRIDGRCGYCL